MDVIEVSSHNYDDYNTWGYFTEWDNAVEYAQIASLHNLFLSLAQYNWDCEHNNEIYLDDVRRVHWRQDTFTVSEWEGDEFLPIETMCEYGGTYLTPKQSINIRYGFDMRSDNYCYLYDKDGNPYAYLTDQEAS